MVSGPALGKLVMVLGQQWGLWGLWETLSGAVLERQSDTLLLGPVSGKLVVVLEQPLGLHKLHK